MVLANTSKTPELNLITNELKIRQKRRPLVDDQSLEVTTLAQFDHDASNIGDQIRITHINHPGDFYVVRVKDMLKIKELGKSLKSKVRS